MFEKLLSLLPYNPSLAQQVSFYSRRMREEATVRRTGLIFLVLAFLVQFFAVISPPQATVADSTNDLIDGGFSSRSEAVGACRSNTKYYGDILSNYGISCDDVAAASTVTIKSTDDSNQLYSMGWNPEGSVNADTHKKTNETPANLIGLPRAVYWRYLSSWDTGAYSSYEVLRVVSSSTHHVFYIMYHCGNLVSVGIPPAISPCLYNSSLLSTSNQCIKPCQYNSQLAASSSQCVAPCPIAGKSSLPQTSSQCFAPCPYNSKIAASSPQCFKPCQYNSAIPATSDECFKPCQFNQNIASDSPQCKPCTSATGSSDTLACVTVSKTASDPTQNWPDANNKTAQPGDTIVYTLFAKNTGQATVSSFLMQENLSDVLDYADVVSLDGGSIDNTTGEVSWPTADIQADATLSHQITVKVKDPIPQTPVSLSDPGHFDLIMTNVYGNTININVPGTPVKTIENTSTTLVNTGPGTSLFVGAVIMVLAGYFYGRARLLAKESALALQANAVAN
jgi:uncharacterized repeat protein (TIGR01451 family)